MNSAQLHLSMIYTGAFSDPRQWTSEDHLAGLAAVFAAGADAQRRKELAA
jgi:hypothetical protein